MKTLYQLEITAEPDIYELVCAKLLQTAGWQEETKESGQIILRCFANDASFLQNLCQQLQEFGTNIKLALSEKPDEDWLSTWKQHFKPVRVGQFVILPPWHQGCDDRIPIVIEPKNAFGTGQHESTALCLELFSSLAIHSGRCLDLGCGTGILGIAAAKLGLTALGLDIDADAIQNAKENAQTNHVQLSLKEGSIEACGSQQFDLIFANILAEPLTAMAQEISTHLAPKAYLILSGFLQSQAESVLASYTPHNLTLLSQHNQGEWSALCLQKSE